jgi:hypothetical protein
MFYKTRVKVINVLQYLKLNDQDKDVLNKLFILNCNCGVTNTIY